MIERTLFTPDHEAFRDSFRRFMDKEIAPFHEAWARVRCSAMARSKPS